MSSVHKSIGFEDGMNMVCRGGGFCQVQVRDLLFSRIAATHTRHPLAQSQRTNSPRLSQLQQDAEMLMRRESPCNVITHHVTWRWSTTSLLPPRLFVCDRPFLLPDEASQPKGRDMGRRRGGAGSVFVTCHSWGPSGGPRTRQPHDTVWGLSGYVRPHVHPGVACSSQRPSPTAASSRQKE